jgi:DNA polymerase-3 subunit epsilon
MKKEVYTFIDFETTGLNYLTEQVIQVGAVKTDLEREYGRINFYVKLREDTVLSEFIKEYTGITEEHLKYGLEESNAFRILNRFIGNSIVVAQSVPFDFSFMSRHYVNNPKFICTRTLAKLVEPKENPSLKYVSSRYGITNNNPHDALSDVLTTIEVFKKLKPLADEQSLQYRNLVGNFKDRPITFVPHKARVITFS